MMKHQIIKNSSFQSHRMYFTVVPVQNPPPPTPIFYNYTILPLCLKSCHEECTLQGEKKYNIMHRVNHNNYHVCWHNMGDFFHVSTCTRPKVSPTFDDPKESWLPDQHSHKHTLTYTQHIHSHTHTVGTHSLLNTHSHLNR